MYGYERPECFAVYKEGNVVCETQCTVAEECKTTEEMELLHSNHDCACCVVADKARIENNERYKCNYCPLNRNLCDKEHATLYAFLTQYNKMVDVYMTTGIKPKEQAFKKFRKRIINIASIIYSKEWEGVYK